MLTKTEIGQELERQGVAKAGLVKAVLTGLADLAEQELARGEGFSIPGLVRIDWSYTQPLVKGEKYKKGDTYTGFGGVEQTAEADSKPRKASVKMRAAPAAPLKRIAPSPKDVAAVRRFLSSKAGKTIVSRKG